MNSVNVEEYMHYFHPLANEYPLMGQEELEELAESIKDKGQIHKVVLHNGLILDGRNRWIACTMADMPCGAVNYSGPTDEDSLRAYVRALNEHRRHDTPEVIRERRQKRNQKILELRREGHSVRAISEQIDAPPTTVHRVVSGVPLEHLEPETQKVTGRDGRKYSASKAKEVKTPEQIEQEGHEAGERILKEVAAGTFPREYTTGQTKQRTDSLGIPIPERLKEVFSHEILRGFDLALEHLNSARRTLELLCTFEGGAILRTHAGGTRDTEKGQNYTFDELEILIDKVEQSVPKIADCPFVYRKNPPHDDHCCSLCAGRGWLSSLRHYDGGPELIQTMLDAHGVTDE